MDLELKGKRALVTGASRGIGLAIARGLAAEGCDVALAARGAGPLEVAAAEMSARFGVRAAPVVGDTSSADGAEAIVARAADALGGLDILVNNAAPPALGSPPALSDLSEADVVADFNVKVLGYLRCAKAAAPHMLRSGWGRIINVSGLNARQSGSISGSIRNVSVAALTKNLADELGPHGVNVSVVHPGFTRTEGSRAALAARAARAGTTGEALEARLAAATSIGRLITAAEVADLVVFLASPRSVAVSGDAIACGGGARGAIHY